MSNNTPLIVLTSGLVIVAILSLLSLPETQNTLKQALQLEQPSTNIAGVVEEANTAFTVSRVVDGDTIVLQDGRTVRYLNVDTPETKKPGTQVQCFGPEAASFNKNLTEGKKVQLRSDKEDEDRYGRDLRFVFVEGTNQTKIEESINYKLVVEGYARASIIKPNNTYQRVFQEAESKAKEQKKGVWNCPNPFQN